MTDIDFGFTGRELFLIENKKGKAEKRSYNLSRDQLQGKNHVNSK
jgi:hypothetical protein